MHYILDIIGYINQASYSLYSLVRPFLARVHIQTAPKQAVARRPWP